MGILRSILFNLSPIEIGYLCSITKDITDLCKDNLDGTFWFAVLVGDVLRFAANENEEVIERFKGDYPSKRFGPEFKRQYMEFAKTFLRTKPAHSESYTSSEYNLNHYQSFGVSSGSIIMRYVFAYFNNVDQGPGRVGSEDRLANAVKKLKEMDLGLSDESIRILEGKIKEEEDLDIKKELTNHLQILIPYINFMKVYEKHNASAFFQLDPKAPLASKIYSCSSTLSIDFEDIPKRCLTDLAHLSSMLGQGQLDEKLASQFKNTRVDLRPLSDKSGGVLEDPMWIKTSLLSLKNTDHNFGTDVPPLDKMTLLSIDPSYEGPDSNMIITIDPKYETANGVKENMDSVFNNFIFKDENFKLKLVFSNRSASVIIDKNCEAVLGEAIVKTFEDPFVCLSINGGYRRIEGAISAKYLAMRPRVSVNTDSSGVEAVSVYLKPFPIDAENDLLSIIVRQTVDLLSIENVNGRSNELVIPCAMYEIKKNGNKLFEVDSIVGFCNVYYKNFLSANVNGIISLTIRDVAFSASRLFRSGMFNDLLSELVDSKKREMVYLRLEKEHGEKRKKKEEEKRREWAKWRENWDKERKERREKENKEREDKERMRRERGDEGSEDNPVDLTSELTPFIIKTEARLGKSVTDSRVSVEYVNILGKESYILYDEEKNDVYCDHKHESMAEIKAHFKSNIPKNTLCPKCENKMEM
jgi:hypothetical protein